MSIANNFEMEPPADLPLGIEDVMAVFETEGLIPLLRPIVDITKNWDFDMCKSLESYIQFLRMYDAESTHFPIAATILQNTSNIYSKKVDFLHSTTLQLLEILRRKHSGKRNKETDGEEKSGDENQEHDGMAPKRKKKTNTLEQSEEMFPLDDIMSDKCLEMMDFESELANVKELDYIIPNTAVTLKPKPNTAINIYSNRGEIFGQKHEFRLHWNVSNDGILTEEFNYDNRNVILEYPRHCHDTVFQLPHNSDDEDDLGLGVICSDIHHEDVLRERQDSTKRPQENLVNECDLNYWLQRAPQINVTENPINKKNTKKIPPQQEDDERENKRKLNEFGMALSRYDIIHFLMDHLTKYNVLNLEGEATESSQAKQSMLQQRRRYNNVPGLIHVELDLDEENDEINDDDEEVNCYHGNDIDIPLPSQDLFIQNPANTQESGDTYEDVARKTLQDFRTQKRSYDYQRIDLAKKVAAWHQLILSKLEEAEERAYFDIHEYCSRILDKFPESNGKPTLPFEKVVEHEKKEEIARYFLSSLMLANSYNIEISKSDPTDLAIDCMNLTLLSRTRHYDQLDDNMCTKSKNN